MKILKKIKRKILQYNSDIIAVYRIKIYLSNNKFLKLKIFRLIFLLSLFCKKYVLKKNVYLQLNKCRNTMPNYQESGVSKRVLPVTILKNCIESDVIFINIQDFILEYNLSPEYLNKLDSLTNENIISINKESEYIYNILKNNEKEIVFINETPEVELFLKKVLEKRNMDSKLITIYNKENISDVINDMMIINYKSKKNCVYIGKVLSCKLNNKDILLKEICYENAYFWGKNFRPLSSRCIDLNVYSQLINNKIHNTNKPSNKYYEFGFIYGGIINYYVFMKMIENNNTLDQSISQILKLLNDKISHKDKIFLDKLFKCFFFNVSDNIQNDDFNLHNNFSFKMLKKYNYIRNGINDFCDEYEKKLIKIKGINEVDDKTIIELIMFFIANKNKKIWRIL